MSESAKALRKIFRECHKEWEAANSPHCIASGEAEKKWERRTETLCRLVQAELAVRTAPPGQLHIVYVDPDTGAPTFHSDHATIASVQCALAQIPLPQPFLIKVYSGEAREIDFSWP